MKKHLLFGLMAGCLLLCSSRTFAQINYSDDFDEAESSWPANEFIETAELACGGDSYRVNLYTGFVPNTTAETVSESIGTSNGTQVTLTYDYKILETMNAGSPALNANDWGNFTIYYGTSSTGPFTALETINTANHIESSSCATRTVTFTPANDSEVYLKIVTNLGTPTPTNHISFYFDNFTAEQEAAGPCDTEAPIAEAEQTLCGGSTLADLEAEGDTIIWYSTQEGGEPLMDDTALEDGLSYFAAQLPDAGCESDDRTEVVVTLMEVEQPQAEASQTFCGEAEVHDLEAEETDPEGEIVWYDAENDGNILSDDTVLEDGEVYYVAQVVDGCTSKRVAVTVAINVTPEPEAESPQIIIGESPLTADLYEDIEVIAEGTITWYETEEDAEEGENALPEGTVIDEGGTYYVTQTIDGCESEYVPVEIQMVLSNDDFSTNKFSYYPNPIENILTLSYTDAITQVEVFNMLGQKIAEQASDSPLVEFDMRGFATGTYIIRALAGDKLHTFKVFKK